MIPIPNQRMSSQKGDHFKRKFHCPTIDFQGMFARSWSNILIFLKIDTSLNYVVYIYIYIYIHTGIFIQLHFISKGCPPEKERSLPNLKVLFNWGCLQAMWHPKLFRKNPWSSLSRKNPEMLWNVAGMKFKLGPCSMIGSVVLFGHLWISGLSYQLIHWFLLPIDSTQITQSNYLRGCASPQHIPAHCKCSCLAFV